MNIMTRLLFGLTACLLLSGATIYKHVDEQGNVSFSDSPAQGSSAVELPPSSTYAPVPITRRETLRPSAGKPEDAGKAEGYRSARILSPEHEATVRDNEGKVTVMGVSEPTLHEGHQARLLVNGSAYGEPQRSLTFRLEDLHRGEYTVKLQIINAAGRTVAESDSNTFFMRQASRLNPPR